VLERYELQTFMMLLEISAGVFDQRPKYKQYQAWIMFLTFPVLKIKRTELDQLAKILAESGCDALARFNQLQFPDLSVWQKQQLENRMDLIKLAMDKRLRANQLFNRYIRETDFYKGISDSAFSRQQVDDRIATIQGFVRFIAKLNILACDAYEYLQSLKAIKLNQKKQTGVVISSIHRAKGLEWPVVILPALTEHYYPYQEKSDMQKATSVESERRLFYVAMTRAKQQLHLIAPHKEGSQHEISPFIQTMNVEATLSVRKSIAQGEKELALPKSLLDSVNRYIKQLDWPIKLTTLVHKQPSTNKKSTDKVGQTNTDTRSEQKERVNHHKFGDGFINYETDRHWHIQFDDGQLRVLDKKIADPHVKWI
jgi:DNA helicase-2/ATP-dependent DNA helicase PcrA